MNIYLTILIEFLLISSGILILFRLRSKIGLAPLYILLGAVQYIQALSTTMIKIAIFGKFTLYPGSVILFSAVLFAVLLIYIKEGVISARILIIGIIISNFLLTLFFEISYQQELIVNQISELNKLSVFFINYKFFIIGTLILFFDFILLVVIYQFLILKTKQLPYFITLFASLLFVLIFDAITFNLLLKFNSPDFTNSLISHIVGKSVSALIFSVILYLYLKYFELNTAQSTFVVNQKRDIFSIIRYQKKYMDLIVEKKQVEKKLVSQIESTLNHISDGFVSLDTNWRYTYVNEKAGEFLGRSPKSLIGKHIWTEFPEGVGLPFYNAYYKAVETQKTQYFKEYYKPLNKWFENRIYPSSNGLTIYFTDITENIKAEENNQKLLSLIETSDDFVGLATLKGKPIYLNTNGRKLVGLSPDEEIPSSIADFFPEKYQDKIENEHLPSIYENNKWNGEVELKNFKTGKLIPVEMSGFLIRDRVTHKAIALGNVATDITARKLAEKEIEEIQQKLEAAIRIGKIGYWSWDIIHDEVYWSDLMFEIYDVDKNTPLKYNSVLDRVHPDDREFHNTLTKQRIENKSNAPFEYRIKWRDNTVKYVMVQMEVVDDEAGNAIKFQGTVIDITKLKEAEEQITKSKKYLDNIINNIGDPVFVKDEQSNLLLVNDAFCAMFNLEKDEIIGNTLAKNVPIEEREIFFKTDKQVLATGVENINEESLTINNIKRIISTKKTRFIDDNGNKFLIGTIRDITDRKNAEIEIEKHKNHLEELVKLRTEEIEAKNTELQRINKLFVGRELKMKELKKIIKELQLKNDH